MASSPSVTNKSSSASPIQSSRTARRRATLPELLLVLRRALSLGLRFWPSERLRERDRYVDRVQDRRLRGRNRRLTTTTMRRSMIVCRLAQLAHQQKAKDGSDEPLPFMRAYRPRKTALEAIPRSQASVESPNSRSPRTSARSSANSYPGRSSIRRHASSNSRGEPDVENTRSATTRLDLRHP
jgi:hypothetical protein